MRLVASVALLVAALGVSSVPSNAADMPIKAAPPVAVATWNGLYVGVHVGAGWGTVESNIPIGGVAFPISSHGTNGVLGGVQAGYNIQTAGWAVLGVEANWTASGVRGEAPCLVVLTCRTETRWLANFTGRVGGVVAANTLVYVKGGAAWAHDEYSAAIGPVSVTGSSDRWGYVLGMGAEYKFAHNWSGLIEYNFNDFGSRTVTMSGALVGGINPSIRNQLHVVKAGLNYKIW